jgi:tetratricopeptide (TPR) repeat protein
MQLTPIAVLHDDPATATAIRTTDGTIALRNLQAQIDGLERQTVHERLPSSAWVNLIDLLALRGELLGRIRDYEWAAALAERLVAESPAEGMTFVARARTLATFHRFAEALSDLDRAERLGIDPLAVKAERAAALHQLGRAEEALTLARTSADRRPGFTSLAALAVLHAERGEAAIAEPLFAESRARYRSVSPFPLALLDFQRGRMWLSQDDPQRARSWFAAAAQRVPAYAPAQGHLAEVDATLGHAEAAVARLRPLTVSADDPDYAAQLARIFGAIGQVDEARTWRTCAAARYDELIARHPAAFADHAAEFWLGVGGDPQRALGLARLNAEARRTSHAVDLLARADLASAETDATERRRLDGTIDRSNF